MMRTESEWINILMDCIERLMDLLRTTHAKEEAERIYDEFFGN